MPQFTTTAGRVLHPAFPPALTRSENIVGYKPDAQDLEGLYQYFYEMPDGLVLDCRLDYEPLEAVTYDNAGYAAQITLQWAMVEGVNVDGLLDIGQKLAIEIAAMQDMLAKAEADRMAA